MIKEAVGTIAKRFGPQVQGTELRVIEGSAVEMEPDLEEMAQAFERADQSFEHAKACRETAWSVLQSELQRRGLVK